MPFDRITGDPKARPDSIVRRYMDLAKFLDLLRTSALYLCRADKFSDRFEGALTPAIRRAMEEAHQQGMVAYSADVFYQRARQGCYVSCWNLAADDNMALWQLYGGAATSVAVTSTVGKLLKAAAGWQDHVSLRAVQYIDHFRNPNMAVGWGPDLLQFKHKAYSFEKELRIIVPREDDWETNPAGVSLPLGDLNAVIRSVVVAPEAPPWFFDLVADVTRKYGVHSPVRRSRLTFLPK